MLNMYGLKSLVKQKCYKISPNPSCLDLTLEKCHKNFQSSKLFEAGLSNFHKVTVSVAVKVSAITHLEMNLIRNC